MKFITHGTTTGEENMNETGLINQELTLKDIAYHDEYWIGDTGATTHITNSMAGIYNCAYPAESIKIMMGNGAKVNR